MIPSPTARIRIAIVMACFNRRETTLRCLYSIMSQQSDDIQFEVFLLDDASPDGTGDVVRAKFPQVHLLLGTGDLFWGGGMHVAMTEARRHPFDFMLWLNDDVVLKPGAVATLLSSYGRVVEEQSHQLHVIVGAMQDPLTGLVTYAGFNRRNAWHPAQLCIVLPNKDRMTPCDTLNGNCVLVPAAIVDKIGIIDPAFVHQLGDIDYGYRVAKVGGKVWISSESIGFCPRNPPGKAWLKQGLTWQDRITLLLGPRGLPFRPWSTFYRRYGGLRMPVLLAATYWNAFRSPKKGA